MVGSARLAALRDAFAEETGNRRNVLDDVPATRALLSDPAVANLLRTLFPPEAEVAAVRGILFDKNPSTNWAVAWHRDLSIAVAERPAPGSEPPGFGPWSKKAGVVHVEPPAELLAGMLTLRLHLDRANAANGALRVRTGSHRASRLADPAARENPAEETLEAEPGDAVLMRPLLLHASSKAERPTRRRVLHVEFAAAALPPPLRWASRHRVAPPPPVTTPQ